MTQAPTPATPGRRANALRVRCIDLDTRNRPIVLLRADSPLCRAEGFAAHARVRLESSGRSIIATLFQTGSDSLAPDEIGLSNAAASALRARDGDEVQIRHPRPLASISSVRGKVHGKRLDAAEFQSIMRDVVDGRYDDIQLAMLLTAIAAHALDDDELSAMTEAMVGIGDRLEWPQPMRMDKHCVGGLPGNRTTPLIVAIVAACGLTIPKTSSRAITSPAGTADTMETLAPVELTLDRMRRVVDAEGGCIAWGGSVGLSPADDMLIRVSRVMDLDAEAQLVASVLSKKIAAGATHVVLDLPVGPTAKVRSHADGERLALRLRQTAKRFGLITKIILTDGSQPIGNGIGPALEARDVLAVLHNQSDQPADLRRRAVQLAGELLELGNRAARGDGETLAAATLESGAAWRKFEAICIAQGGLRTPPRAARSQVVEAPHAGRIESFDNRRLGQVAKLAGAPAAPAAGITLHVHAGNIVERGQPLYTIHAETIGELDYAREYAGNNGEIVAIGPAK